MIFIAVANAEYKNSVHLLPTSVYIYFNHVKKQIHLLIITQWEYIQLLVDISHVPPIRTPGYAPLKTFLQFPNKKIETEKKCHSINLPLARLGLDDSAVMRSAPAYTGKILLEGFRLEKAPMVICYFAFINIHFRWRVFVHPF